MNKVQEVCTIYIAHLIKYHPFSWKFHIYTQKCIKNIVHYAFNTCILDIYEINHENRVIYENNPSIIIDYES